VYRTNCGTRFDANGPITSVSVSPTMKPRRPVTTLCSKTSR